MKRSLLVAILCWSGLAFGAAAHDKGARNSTWQKHTNAQSHSSSKGSKASMKPGWFKRSGKGGTGRVKR
jgi:hypothetical protein